jgi:hypothetical protein
MFLHGSLIVPEDDVPLKHQAFSIVCGVTIQKMAALFTVCFPVCVRLIFIIPVTLVCYLQGVNFYTEVKTVTQMWRESDVSHSKAAVSMPVMQ